MNVRVAVGADADSLAAIARDAFGHYRSRMDRDPAPMLADYGTLARSGHVHVALVGALVAGYVDVRTDGDVAVVDNIAVSPHHQGKGVGVALLAHAETLAAQRGHDSIVLSTNEVMTENLGFYARRGYRETGRIVEDGYRRVRLEKALRPTRRPAGRRSPPDAPGTCARRASCGASRL